MINIIVLWAEEKYEESSIYKFDHDANLNRSEVNVQQESYK